MARGKQAKSGPLVVEITLDANDVETVEVDMDTFTFRELFEARRALARFTIRDDDGQVLEVPTQTEKVLVFAWVVLRRVRPDVTFDVLLNLRPAVVHVGGSAAAAVAADVSGAQSPEA